MKNHICFLFFLAGGGDRGRGEICSKALLVWDNFMAEAFWNVCKFYCRNFVPQPHIVRDAELLRVPNGVFQTVFFRFLTFTKINLLRGTKTP